MKDKEKKWRIVPLIIIGMYLNYKFVRDADDEFIFDGFIQFLIGSFFIITLVWISLKDINAYKKGGSITSYFPTLIGIMFILSFVITNYLLESRDNSPVIIHAGYDGGYNGAWFEFREDGTYKFVDHAGIGATYYRGKYDLNDTLITLLDWSEIDQLLESNKLAIRLIQRPDTLMFKLYQINDDHEIVDKEFSFFISQDNRQK